MYWHMHPTRGIESARERADAATRRARTLERRVEELEQQVLRLLLIQRAVWELTRDQLGLEDAGLAERVGAIDVAEHPGEARECPACSRMMSKMHGMCLYCGTLEP